MNYEPMTFNYATLRKYWRHPKTLRIVVNIRAVSDDVIVLRRRILKDVNGYTVPVHYVSKWHIDTGAVEGNCAPGKATEASVSPKLYKVIMDMINEYGKDHPGAYVVAKVTPEEERTAGGKLKKRYGSKE